MKIKHAREIIRFLKQKEIIEQQEHATDKKTLRHPGQCACV